MGFLLRLQQQEAILVKSPQVFQITSVITTVHGWSFRRAVRNCLPIKIVPYIIIPGTSHTSIYILRTNQLESYSSFGHTLTIKIPGTRFWWEEVSSVLHNSQIISNKLGFNEIIILLCDHALLEPNGTPGGYGMHSCVHAWTMNLLNSERDISMTNFAFNCVGSTMPDRPDLEYLSSQRRLLPHAEKLLRICPEQLDVEFREQQPHIRRC